MELVIIAPILIAVTLFLVAAGRIAVTSTAMDSAASAAARAASLETTKEAAQAAAQGAASETLSRSGYLCSQLTIDIDDAGLTSPLGTTGTVQVTIDCTLNLSDVALPGLGGSRDFTATAISPVDSFRERD